MKTIKFKATFQTGSGNVWSDEIVVTARNINAGWRVAFKRALSGLHGTSIELAAIEFVEVV